MTRPRMIFPGLATLALLCWVSPGQRLTAESPRPVQVGMVQTLFTDIPKSLVDLMAYPFGTLVKEQTGVDGQLVIAGDAFYVGKLLQENKYQFGIFQGIEFAWARQKYPGLRPLMIAVSYHHLLHANLVVAKEAKTAGIADLKGKKLALPQRSKSHCWLFLEKLCNEGSKCEAKSFFNQIKRTQSVEDALDDILLGNVDAAVVDGLGLEFYQSNQPGCYKRLKVLQQSEAFPTGVIAYHEGALDQATLNRFRQGMVNAHKSAKARPYLEMFQLSGFETIPADFHDTMANILRAYPAPEAATERTSIKSGPSSQ